MKCAPAGRSCRSEKRERFVARLWRDAVRCQCPGQRPAAGRLFRRGGAKARKKPKNVANWIINDLLSALAAAGKTDRRIARSPPHALDELVNLIDERNDQQQAGKEVFAEMFAQRAKRPRQIVEEKGT